MRHERRPKPVTISDVVYEYLGRPKTLAEMNRRMQEQLTDKERKLLHERLTVRPAEEKSCES
jgi:hypothetical protein